MILYHKQLTTSKRQAFLVLSMSLFTTYLSEKYKRKDPIALSKKPNEKRQIKVSRGFQSVTTIKDIQNAVKTDLVKLSFGEGSRGGRGVQNKGGQFEVDLTKDLVTWWEDGTNYKSKFTRKDY